MMTVAILTGNTIENQWLSKVRKSLEPFLTKIVRDVPDPSFRSLTEADFIVFGPDVPHSRTTLIQRALSRIGNRAGMLVVLPKMEPVDQLMGYFQTGARAVALESDDENEIHQAVALGLRGWLYLSPGLTPPVLERYRELCAELRESRDHGYEPANFSR